MAKNVVVLNGSPHKEGNTSGLVAEFVRGARESGNNVVQFWLQPMNIHGCLGCMRGDSTRENPCAQDDDMAQIYPYLKAADVIVLASPLYYWNFSSQLTTAIDRMLALEENKSVLRGSKSGVLLMTAMGDEFRDAVQHFDTLMDNFEWENLGTVVSGGNAEEGDIKNKMNKLEAAYEIGRAIR